MSWPAGDRSPRVALPGGADRGRGQECIAAGLATIDGLEQRITQIQGKRGRQQLRGLLEKLLDAGEADDLTGRLI